MSASLRRAIDANESAFARPSRALCTGVTQHRGEPARLAVLHVSRLYRGEGIGRALTDEVVRLARADRAARLYVAARTYSDERLIHLKGALFLLLGVTASALLLYSSPTLQTAALLGIAVWAFCRASLRLLRDHPLRRSVIPLLRSRVVRALPPSPLARRPALNYPGADELDSNPVDLSPNTGNEAIVLSDRCKDGARALDTGSPRNNPKNLIGRNRAHGAAARSCR